ncbi:hypothetical protein FA13DRAFT_1789085 [Coprinellus micaceus]|uniref:Uncharacterized protein n=1 Tax=Coprinellus micaceus TaxID=71717 RepID=A0A4Y7TMA2_COPMI|nr:hypothetical protein FA13DRAFT_1789085 [Coprinellus micaceus]
MVAATVQEELVRLCNRHQASEGTIGQLYGEVRVALREAERVQGLDETLKAVCEQQEELSTEVKVLEQVMEEAAKTTQELQKSTAKSLAETDGRFEAQASRLKQQGDHFNSLGREQEKLSQRVSEVERRLGSTELPSEVQEGQGIAAESSERSQGVEESIAKGEALGDGAGETIGRLRVTVEETAMKVTEFGERLEGIRSMVEELSSKTKQEIEESIAEHIGEHIDAKGDTGLDTVQGMINDVELSLSSEMGKRLDELNQRVDNIQARIGVVQEEAKDFRAEVLSSLDCIFNAITQPPPSPMHDTSPLTPRRAGSIRIPARAGTSAVAVGAGASASAPVPVPIGSVSVAPVPAPVWSVSAAPMPAPVPEPVRSGGKMGVAGPLTGRPKAQVVTTGFQNMGKDEDEEMEELLMFHHESEEGKHVEGTPQLPATVALTSSDGGRGEVSEFAKDLALSPHSANSTHSTAQNLTFLLARGDKIRMPNIWLANLIGGHPVEDVSEDDRRPRWVDQTKVDSDLIGEQGCMLLVRHDQSLCS